MAPPPFSLRLSPPAPPRFDPRPAPWRRARPATGRGPDARGRAAGQMEHGGQVDVHDAGQFPGIGLQQRAGLTDAGDIGRAEPSATQNAPGRRRPLPPPPDPLGGVILGQINGEGRDRPAIRFTGQAFQPRRVSIHRVPAGQFRTSPSTVAPRAASNMAVARPMPEAAPVTTARRLSEKRYPSVISANSH